MLLRSSSTPVVQSIFPDSPNRDFDTNHHCTKYPPQIAQHEHHSPTKLISVHGGHHHHQHLSSSSFSCNSSPISHDFNRKTNNLGYKAFRRARSDGNLEGLGSSSFDLEDHCNLKTGNRSLHKHSKTMLQTAPSFSIYTSGDELEAENEEEGLERETLVKGDGSLERSVTIGDSIEGVGGSGFSFGEKCMALIEENDEDEILSDFQNLGIEEAAPASPPMYLATGLGIDGSGFGGVGGGRGNGGAGYFSPACFNDGGNLEEYYKRMVGEDPFNPLFLRNYAQLLQSKGDLFGAEEHYLRATLADPKDGEILMLYAKLVWELHHDQDTALNYFEQAAQAAPGDSHVLAAYAYFLWEIDVDKKDDFFRGTDCNDQVAEDKDLVGLQSSAFGEGKQPVNVVADVHFECIRATAGEKGSMEEYYERMIEENPSNPLLLRNYAQFLYQSKGDPKGAEEYYSRAILVDPRDGEIISQYAKLVWELYHDQEQASSFFEQAVRASPDNSHVLAAYASFLWETAEEEEEEESTRQDHIGALNCVATATSVNN